jgi:hypothetical protein
MILSVAVFAATAHGPRTKLTKITKNTKKTNKNVFVNFVLLVCGHRRYCERRRTQS